MVKKLLIDVKLQFKSGFILNVLGGAGLSFNLLTEINFDKNSFNISAALHEEKNEKNILYNFMHLILGLATNAIVLCNTVYMQAALEHLRAQGEVIKEEDEARLSPLGRKHINFLGHFSFMLPKVVSEGKLRPLNVAEELELA